MPELHEEKVDALHALFEEIGVEVREYSLEDLSYTALLRIPEHGMTSRGPEMTTWYDIVYDVLFASEAAEWEQHICRRSAIERGTFGYVWHVLLYASAPELVEEALTTFVDAVEIRSSDPALYAHRVPVDSVALAGGVARNIQRDIVGKAPNGASKVLPGGSRGATPVRPPGRSSL